MRRMRRPQAVGDRLARSLVLAAGVALASLPALAGPRELGPAALPTAPLQAAPGSIIEHHPVGCVLADRFPVIEARFDPGQEIATAHVYFRAEAGSHWYYVKMPAQGGPSLGILPKPKKDAGGIRYLIVVTDKTSRESRTPEFAADVLPASLSDVASSSGCPNGLPVANVTKKAERYPAVRPSAGSSLRSVHPTWSPWVSAPSGPP